MAAAWFAAFWASNGEGYCRALVNHRGIDGRTSQRLCIARAIAVGPQVLLTDEPCSELDPKSTAAIEELITVLSKTYTIVIVTHNMQQAARTSDFCAFMFQRDMIELGSTQKMFTNPDNEQIENYITGRFGECRATRRHRSAGWG